MLNLAYNMKIDDKAIKRAVDKAAPETLSQAGRYVMGIVRASLHQRRDPNKSSVPGMRARSIAASNEPSFTPLKKIVALSSSARSSFASECPKSRNLTNSAALEASSTLGMRS